MPKKHARKDTPTQAEKHAGGRPSEFNLDVAVRICARIAGSKDSLRTICKADEMPSVQTVLNWLGRYPEFVALYARSKQEQAEMLVEEMIEIADDGRNDTYTTEDGEERVDSDVIQRSKLRIDTRKWLASKLLPKKYGDKLDMDIAHSGRIEHQVTLTEERRNELMERRRAALTKGVN